MEAGDGEDAAVLVLSTSDNRPPDGGEDNGAVYISTSEVSLWDLPRILRSPIVRVHASRRRLVERSSYFRGLLGWSFSESASDEVSIRCNFYIMSTVLQSIFDFPVQLNPENYLLLLEISVITSASFVDLPFDLLCSCLEHSDLTVHSEEQLCEALLDWIENRRNEFDNSCVSEEACLSILSKVRVFLLSLRYLTGKRKSSRFSSTGHVNLDCIVNLMQKWPSNLLSLVEHDDLDIFKVRLTKFSQKINISCCVHLPVEILYLAVLPRDMEVVSKKRLLQAFPGQGQRNKDGPAFMKTLPEVCYFDKVSEVDLSKCAGLNFSALIIILSYFPSLSVVNISYCSRFKIEDFFVLLRNCPSLTSSILTVDISPVTPCYSSITLENYSHHDSPFESERLQYLASNIRSLTFEGRSDLQDTDLLTLSALSSSIRYLNLKGCIRISDFGISKILEKCSHLQSLIVSHTCFGMNSVLMLCKREVPSFYSGPFHDFEHSSTIAFRLKVLQMDGCDFIEARHMKQLFRCLYLLTSLSSCKTCLSDDVLSEYRGSLLEGLDISETQVSLCGLYHVVRRNPCIKLLRARGCPNFSISENIPSNSTAIQSCEDLLINEMNNSYLLEDVAVGWGFTSLSLLKLKKAFLGVKLLSFGLGSSVDISLLPEMCPSLETLTLRFQTIYDRDMRSIMQSLANLRVLELQQCQCDFTLDSLRYSMKKLKSLRLVRAIPWLTDADLAVLSENCSNLVEFSLSGCKLLSPEAQKIISMGWPGLTLLHLEDCGSITSDGVSSLLDCIAMEDLLLRHNGKGIKKNVISNSVSKMPLLRKIALDTCDASEGGFEDCRLSERHSLCIVRISGCKAQMCAFGVGKRPVHKDTMVQTWNSRELWMTYVKERI